MRVLGFRDRSGLEHHPPLPFSAPGRHFPLKTERERQRDRERRGGGGGGGGKITSDLNQVVPCHLTDKSLSCYHGYCLTSLIILISLSAIRNLDDQGSIG